MRLRYLYRPSADVTLKWLKGPPRPDGHECCLSAAVTRKNPALTCKLRKAAILEGYRGDYKAAELDNEVVIRRVSKGKERVYFWGKAQKISELRSIFSGNKRTSLSSKKEIGTTTLLVGSCLARKGYAEIGRLANGWASNGPFEVTAMAIREAFAAWDPQRLHTVIALPRNRPGGPRAVAGVPAQRMHLAEIRSNFWGIAPWYVLQENKIELLDYREVSRSPSLVKEGISSGGPVYVADPGDRAYVRNLFKLNGLAGPAIVVRRGGNDEKIGWNCPARVGTNVLYLTCPSQDGTGMNLENIERSHLKMKEPVAIVEVPMEDEKSLKFQRVLKARGYLLTCVSPPKAIPFGRKKNRDGLTGYWYKNLATLKTAAPYYFSVRELSSLERSIIQRLKKLESN